MNFGVNRAKVMEAMGTPIQFGPLRLNEPFELPSEFMFWLFPRRIAGFKEGNF